MTTRGNLQYNKAKVCLGWGMSQKKIKDLLN